MIFSKSNSGNKYKFNSLKVYAWDRSFGSKKKYRRLFDGNELNYLSAEISLYNKLFDEEDWEMEIELIANKIIDDDNTEELCKKKEKVTVSQDENIFTYSFGWGSDDRGSFWKKGEYEWEAYIDGELISSSKFYVEDMGIVSGSVNPYLSILSLSTYEAPDGDLDIGDRIYLKSFDVAKTRYIMGEVKFVNQVPHEWLCEFFF